MSDKAKEVYCLVEYNFWRAEVISEGPKTFKVQVLGEQGTRRVVKEKCARPDEVVCVVWEMWKGVNGRGAYRIEREMYPQERVPAKEINYTGYGPGRLWETSLGVRHIRQPV